MLSKSPMTTLHHHREERGADSGAHPDSADPSFWSISLCVHWNGESERKWEEVLLSVTEVQD